MDKMIADLTSYFSTNGTLADAVAFAQLVASDSYREIAHLWQVVQGTI